jgi:GAF domain-containing protein
LVEESGLDQKALKGKSVWLKDVQTSKYFQYGARAKVEGIKSVLVVPLLLEKNAIGVLRVYADKIREFKDREIKFLEAVANLSAIALDNARMHKTLQTSCDLMTAHKYRIDDN